MYGLIMLREYLEEILVVEKSFYERSYSTNKRGTIVLIFSKSPHYYLKNNELKEIHNEK